LSTEAWGEREVRLRIDTSGVSSSFDIVREYAPDELSGSKASQPSIFYELSPREDRVPDASEAQLVIAVNVYLLIANQDASPAFSLPARCA
jgi:hypothetical protein